MDDIQKDTELFISWIDKGEGLIANDVDFSEVDRYVVCTCLSISSLLS